MLFKSEPEASEALSRKMLINKLEKIKLNLDKVPEDVQMEL